MTQFDVATLKGDFPIFEREVNGRRLTYLDSASSSQKPLAVLDAMDDCYRRYYANIHRGVYSIAEESTAAFEDARRKVANFVGAAQPEEIVFVATRPSRSTSLRTRGPGPICAPATWSCSRTWSITPTSCPGTCSRRSAESSCAGSR
jgi:cysteine desulfurase/selenocysteine lyase